LSIFIKASNRIPCRECVDDILNILDEENITDHSNPGVLHCFTEDDHAAQEFLKRGFYISFSGILTFKKAESLRQTASQIPIDKILIETDAPYLAPAPHRGKKNEPAFLQHTFNCLLELRKMSSDELSAQLWKNSCKIFLSGQ
jgi:TatD DNase family protein